MKEFPLRSARWLPVAGLLVGSLFSGVAPTPAQTGSYEFNDSHFHLTNNIQEGPSIRDLMDMMGSKVGRSTVFGVPLQQEWLYGVDGERAPTYYLPSDAPLYYYSFTDARIAMAYKSLPKEQQVRLDPMIAGFNPADMYAVDHIRRVLQTLNKMSLENLSDCVKQNKENGAIRVENVQGDSLLTIEKPHAGSFPRMLTSISISFPMMAKF
ncbi:MAG TPA: hypothetical protein VGR58_07770 [Candidatus Acidoferrum sp.]|nr:hypothetical protein [Candidatus Acidoferrum sp.]